MEYRLRAPLAPLCTLRLGGAATRLAEITCDEDLVEALTEAEHAGEPVLVLGGGSNVVIADAGWSGMALLMRSRGVTVRALEEAVELRVAAGESFDALVAHTVDSGWAGLECLSGIPGSVGATPIQNVGAYGAEVADVITSVRVYDRARRCFATLTRAECDFGYRASALKQDRGRRVVVAVSFRLVRRDNSIPLRYAELAQALGVAPGQSAPIGRVRETTLALRRAKGMLLDEADPDSVSVGSFFVSPVVDASTRVVIEARARAAGILRDGEPLPCYPAGDGAWKLPAGWLIERAGLRGFTRGAVAVSAKHALALVHRGGGSTRELLALAHHVRDTVQARFGVALTPEPDIVGTSW